MKDQINTIREALEAMSDGKYSETMKVALAALAELERTHYTAEDVADASAQGFKDGVASVTAGQEPVAWLVCSANSDGSLSLEHAAAWKEAAHAHINDAITEHGIEEAASWVVRPAHVAAPVAQQPQAEPVPEGYRIVPDWKGYALLGAGRYLINHAANYDPELGAELIITLATEKDREGGRKIGESRPNAEDSPPVQPEEMVIRIGFLNGDALFVLEDQLTDVRKVLEAAGKAAPQQAEAVPSDVVRDAERYRFLAAHCRSTPEHWGGRWSIVIEGPCPERQDCEDAFDAAIDAAMAQGEKP